MIEEEDPYGNQIYKTRPELLCPPSMKNITGIEEWQTVHLLLVIKPFWIGVRKEGLKTLLCLLILPKFVA